MEDFNTSCINITADQRVARILSRSVLAMICTVITVLMLILLVSNKAYKTVLQRLFLYLTTVVLIQLIFISMNFELLIKFEQQEEVCAILAFFTTWSAASTYLLAMIITLYLLYIMYKKIKGEHTLRVAQSVQLKRTLPEVFVIVFCIVSPLCYMWVPFYHGTYGSTPVACWVINTRISDCTFFGFQDQLGLSFGIFFVTSLTILAVFGGVAILFCTFATRYKLTRHHHLKTICQTLMLMGFMTISALIEVFGVMQFFFNTCTISDKQLPFGVLVIYAGAIPISQMLIPLGFVIYFQSFKKPEGRKKLVCCISCEYGEKKIKRSVHFRPDQVQSTVVQASAPASTRVEARSDTYFSIPYTGEFTSITNPLISNTDTGYGSNS